MAINFLYNRCPELRVPQGFSNSVFGSSLTWVQSRVIINHYTYIVNIRRKMFFGFLILGSRGGGGCRDGEPVARREWPPGGTIHPRLRAKIPPKKSRQVFEKYWARGGGGLRIETVAR